MKRILIIIFCLLFIIVANATHNRAGEITYKQLSQYTFEITVVTFTNTKAMNDGTIPADRPELMVLWGDDTYNVVERSSLLDLPDYYRKNTYTYTHTYPGPGTYVIVVEDPNRNDGVENIPNSVTVVFSIKTILQINTLLGLNNTPYLLNPPIDKAATYRKFIHNPAAYDPDGDSISYQLTVCTGENGEPIPNYILPESSNQPIYIDAEKGDLVWDSPINEGVYNVAFFIEEWRQGVKIGQITRDMQIEVFNSDNTPPIIDSIFEYCIVAGDSLNFIVSASDSAHETVTLTANSGVFEIADPATFNSTPAKGYVEGEFAWQTNCSHIRKNAYQIVFKASDDNSEVSLVDQRATKISVIGPAPSNLQSIANHNSIALSWDSYECSQTMGFNIYRSVNFYDFVPDSCEIGVPSYTGYELIATLYGNEKISYIDNNEGEGLNQGFEYCYMVVALFSDDFEGKASLEVCAELERGTPIITNVSITEHGFDDGEIYLAWSKPIDFDTIMFPGNLQYIVKRSLGLWNNDFETIDTLYSLNDTVYLDKGLNTEDDIFSYKIEIHNANGLTLTPMTASSIKPEIDGLANTLILNVIGNTPWINSLYNIYRENSLGDFDFIGSSNTSVYIDSGLNNNKEYCYRVTSEGAYNLPGIIKPLINSSHQNCGIPLDTIPPQKLSLIVESNCDTYINTLSWIPNYNDNDIVKYYIYYTPDISIDLQVIDSILGPDTLSYIHLFPEFPSGCYAVTAIDSSHNESELSNTVCVDKCNYYELPNVFTPNNDNVHDLYIPITPAYVVDRYIEKVDFKVYSRWGNLVFETTNPNLKWDGKHYKNNNLVIPGVYYYVCDVSEKRVSGTQLRNIVGFIHVFHNKEKKTE